jgi:hypothetical protein
MPLASSRSAAEKRSESVAAERKEQQRRQRLSFPNTIQSSTVVNESKALRRRSSARYQRQSSESSLPTSAVESTSGKENESENNGPNPYLLPPKSPGPTPYWKTTEERGGEMSPRLTRSQSKSKNPPARDEVTGFILNFSPPNQDANARREQAQLKAKDQERYVPVDYCMVLYHVS